jgi:hypothetical protein
LEVVAVVEDVSAAGHRRRHALRDVARQFRGRPMRCDSTPPVSAPFRAPSTHRRRAARLLARLDRTQTRMLLPHAAAEIRCATSSVAWSPA